MTAPNRWQDGDVSVVEYPIGQGAYGVACGADGAVWSGRVGAGELVRVGPDGAVTPIPIPGAGAPASPLILAARPDGAIWFTMADGQIGRVDPAGKVTQVLAVSPADGLYGLCAGPDAALWYTLMQADRIGRLTVDGQRDEYQLREGSTPSLITGGPDGALWCTLNQGNAIARITTAGAVTPYELPTGDAAPVGIHAGHGIIWFTEIGAGQIGRIDPGGAIDEFPLPDRSSRPHAVAALDDGGCWATLWAASAIVCLAPDGRVVEQVDFRPGAEPHGLAVGPDGSVWVALEAGFLARITRGR